MVPESIHEITVCPYHGCILKWVLYDFFPVKVITYISVWCFALINRFASNYIEVAGIMFQLAAFKSFSKHASTLWSNWKRRKRPLLSLVWQTDGMCNFMIIIPNLLMHHAMASNCYLQYSEIRWQMSDDNPYVIPEMDPTLRKQIQECNWQVVNVTTPANYFHVLRRQVSTTNYLISFSSRL